MCRASTCRKSPVHRVIAAGIDQALSHTIEELMKTAGDKAEAAFVLLEYCITKTTCMANDALKRLAVGGGNIASQLIVI